MKSINKLLLTGMLMVLAWPLYADRAADEKTIRTALGGVEAASIEPTAIQGLYEVVVGPHVIYVSADGKYMIQGELMDLQRRVSLTEPRRREARQATMDMVGEDQMIVFTPKEVKHTITVFTDIDCAYCRKLHSELNNYLDAGIKIRYVMYPRAGKGSESYKKAVAVWCADDRNAALTAAKAGKAIKMQTCDNPVDRHMELADMLGIRGTPFIVLENGDAKPGYVPAAQLARLLEQTSNH